MGNEVNEVINNICDKLGYAASEITPEMAKYMIARNMFGVVECVVFMIVAVVIGIMAYRSYKKLESYDREWHSGVQLFAMMASALTFIIFAVALATAGADLIGWIASPKASMVQYVLDAIK